MLLVFQTISALTSYSDIIDKRHQQSGELCKILLFDSGHLYMIKIAGVLEQILEGHHNL